MAGMDGSFVNIHKFCIRHTFRGAYSIAVHMGNHAFVYSSSLRRLQGRPAHLLW